MFKLLIRISEVPEELQFRNLARITPKNHSQTTLVFQGVFTQLRGQQISFKAPEKVNELKQHLSLKKKLTKRDFLVKKTTESNHSLVIVSSKLQLV